MLEMKKLNLVPFLSPMLEDVPGTKSSDSVRADNFHKIQTCIDMVARYADPFDRAIAIKLTAFTPVHLLVKII